MERRSFIKIASVVAASAAAGPVFSRTITPRSIQGLDSLYRTPELAQHVRHGLFQLTEVKLPLLPEWLKFFKGHHMFKNGSSPTAEDLRTFSVQVNGSLITVGFDNNHTFLMRDEEVIELSENYEDDQIILLTGDQKKSLRHLNINTSFVLRGSCQWNDQTFKEGEYSVDGDCPEIELSEEESLVLLVLDA